MSLLVILMTLLIALVNSNADPEGEGRKAALLTKLGKLLCREDLKMSDLPADDAELSAMLSDLGFGGLERVQLRKFLRSAPCNSTGGSVEAPTAPVAMETLTTAPPLPQTPATSQPSPTTTRVPELPKDPAALAALQAKDEELARALQQEEYAAVNNQMGNNASEGGGERAGGMQEFLEDLMQGTAHAHGKAASGVVIRRTVPGDHSCLFSAIAYCAEGPDAVSPGKANELREICAQDVLKDPDPEKRAVLLGVKSVDEYAKWIRNSEHWGGENEIVVLAKHYKMEVAVVSTQAMNIMRYGSDIKDCNKSAYLLYTGQHYDPLVAGANNEIPQFEERRTFPKGDRSYDRLALEAARKHLEQPQITLQVNMPGSKEKDHTYLPEKDINVKFDDVKGCDEAKDEVKEVVLYLKDPDRFTRLGAKLPRGIMLTGSPGTGKTLMARAVAGEAKASFFQCSGSDFDEEYVGVGARRVRQLFEAARNHTPCIVFMDELDAVGGKRQSKEASYHRQTLNALLVELDGFKQNVGLVLVAATNFPESLDPALTRPGRIDKTIHIPLPDIKGRREILEVHSKNVTLEDNVDLQKVAQRTTGMSGADLANLINIAAIRASAEQLPYVPMLYLEEAYDRVAVGASRRSPMSEQEKNTTAYHEGGHALISLKTPGNDPLHKATILPRGSALGITWSVQEGEKYSDRLFEMKARMDMMMGGRAAEEIVFGPQNVSGGCSSDLKHVTHLARQMVMHYGMGGDDTDMTYFDTHDYQVLSEQHKNTLDGRIGKLVKESYARALTVIRTHESELHLLADALMAFETLDAEEIKLAISGKKADIQLRHDAYKEKLSKYAAEAATAAAAAAAAANASAALAALNLTNTSEYGDDLKTAIALSLGNGSALEMEPLDINVYTIPFSGSCTFLLTFLLCVLGLKALHSRREDTQGLREPLTYA